MRMRVFSVYDEKAEAFLQPFFTRTVGEAERMFGDAVNDQESPFCKHAADYTLFEIGEFDQALGELVPCTPRSLGVALTYRHQPRAVVEA